MKLRYPKSVFSKSFFIIAFSFSIFHCSAQQALHTVYFTGCTGKNTTANQNLLNLQKEMLGNPSSTTLFLGDNIYPSGLSTGKESSKKFRSSEKKLLVQLQLLNNYKGNVFFLPGNHDWKSMRIGGLKAVKAQGKYIEDYIDNTVAKNRSTPNFVPSGALPGPYSEMISDNIRLIAIDLQWWLHRQIFHSIEKRGGKKKIQQQFFVSLDSLLNVSREKNEMTIIAAHHPLFSIGHHGVKKQPLRFLINWTPLKIIGWMGLNRMLYQDIPQPRYKKLKKKLLSVINKYENIIYIAAHEHNLQYSIRRKNHFIISGAGSKLTSFRLNTDEVKYANDTEMGFFALHFFNDGSVKLEVFLEKSGKKHIADF